MSYFFLIHVSLFSVWSGVFGVWEKEKIPVHEDVPVEASSYALPEDQQQAYNFRIMRIMSGVVGLYCFGDDNEQRRRLGKWTNRHFTHQTKFGKDNAEEWRMLNGGSNFHNFENPNHRLPRDLQSPRDIMDTPACFFSICFRAYLFKFMRDLELTTYQQIRNEFDEGCIPTNLHAHRVSTSQRDFSMKEQDWENHFSQPTR